MSQQLRDTIRNLVQVYDKTVQAVEAKREEIDAAKQKLQAYTQPAVDAYKRTSNVAHNVFFNLRRRYVWETITATTAVAAIGGIPFGRFAVLRNALVAGVVSTCILNPEYVVSTFAKKEDR